jgi:polysaccharide export outer membrane protein
MMNRYFLALLTALALAAVPRLTAQTQAVPRAVAVNASNSAGAAAVEEPHGAIIPLRPGDTVEIRIANVPLDESSQISGVYTLDESGNLNLPFIGLVSAGGMPPSQVEQAIQNKYVSAQIYTDPTVTVNPPVGARFVSVSGAVKIPGRVPYTSDLTLVSTISAAGGPSDFAGDKIRLTRAGKILWFSRKKLDKDPTLDVPIKPGDQIEIKESAW